MQPKKVKNDYIGIDLGKKTMQAVRILESDKKDWLKTETHCKGLEKLFSWLKQTDIVAIEAGNLAFSIAKQLKARGIDVIVLNPGDLANIYKSLKKTDKEDALKLARLIKRNPREELPEVSVPSDQEEQARRLSSEQMYWRENRVQSINRLHSVFTSAHMTDVTKKDLQSENTRKSLVKKLPEGLQKEALRILREIELSEEILLELDDEIRKTLKEHKKETAIIMSLPGLGPINTLSLLAYIGDGKRFSHGKQVSNYVGLVPRVDISGSIIHYGRTVKRGCKQIKSIIIQAAWALVRSKYSGELGKKYHKLKAKRGKGKAIVAVARKMLELIHHLLITEQLYKYMPEEVLWNKLKGYKLTA